MCGSLGLGSGGSFSPSGTVVGSGGNPSLHKAQCTDERGREEEENHNCFMQQDAVMICWS